MMGLAIRIGVKSACNMAQALVDARRALGSTYELSELSVLCLGCAAVQVEGGGVRDEHAADCPVACEYCTTERVASGEPDQEADRWLSNTR